MRRNNHPGISTQEQFLELVGKFGLHATDLASAKKHLNALANIIESGVDSKIANSASNLITKLTSFGVKGDDLTKLATSLTKSIDLAKAFKADAGLVEFWQLLKKAGRSGLINDFDAIMAVKKIKSNTYINNYISGITEANGLDNFLGKINSWGNTGVQKSYTEIVTMMDKFSNFLGTNNVSCSNCSYLFKRFIIGDAPTGINKQGCFWIMDDIANDLMFQNKSLNIEKITPNFGGNNARVDVFVGGNPPLNIEYKWYGGTVSISKNTFIEEFVNRDLFSITKLEEVQWRLKWNATGTNKLTKTQIVDWMKEIQSTLDNTLKTKIQTLFQTFGRQTNPSLSILDYDDLIDYISQKNEWYNLIFKY